MRLLLKPFQVDAVQRLVERLRRCGRDAASGELQAAWLASPTGSGKTLMASAVIETLLQGDSDNLANPRATFLWLSDQPELNEQTRRKMLAASTVLDAARLVVVDTTFDMELFAPGALYFLNTQKLGRDRSLVTSGDERTYTIWETVANTVADRPGDFFVFIDEAHRGMVESPQARQEASTIIQKFIKGSLGEIPPLPVVVGISATPERFRKLVADAERTMRPIEVPAEEVRASGLLKEAITLYHPRQDQPSDMTMLRAAARTWRDFADQWDSYCAADGEVPVEPILVVQVQDGTGKQLSRTDIVEAIRIIREEVGVLPTTAFAHAFQEGRSVSVGDEELRYLAPPDIGDDPDVRIVFFKSSLNTGWDCPRAEVMMSFRTAIDATLIAQLVGRMVRSPLARRIDANEHLNTVALYLPHYNEQELNRVIDRLSAPDPDIMPPVFVKKGEDTLTLTRAAGSEDAFTALGVVPSYVVPRARKVSQVQRLMKLARLLANDDLYADAPDVAGATLLTVLRQTYEQASQTDSFQQRVTERAKLDVRGVTVALAADAPEATESVQLELAAENVDDLFDAAGRKLGEGLHKAWWKARVTAEGADRGRAKLEACALAADPSALTALEMAAQTTVQRWLKEYQPGMGRLPEQRQQDYNEIRRLASSPEEVAVAYPQTIEVTKGTKDWQQHLYTDAVGNFPATFNRWESAVVTEVLGRHDVVGWLRNVDRKSWSVSIPYRLHGNYQALYPDFLIVRTENGRPVIDILDPHLLSLEDAPAKAAGMAEYAARHGHQFGSIQLIVVDGENVKRLDLCAERVRDKVKTVSSHEHLRQLFALST